MSSTILSSFKNFLARIKRRDPPVKSPLRLHHRRIFVLPTGSGFGYATVVLAILVGAINYTSSLGFMLAFLLIGLGVIAMLYSFRNVNQIEIYVGAALPVFAGEVAQFPITLKVCDRLERYALQIDNYSNVVSGIDIAAHSSTALTLSQPCPKRGVQYLDRFTIRTQFPLGLVRPWAPLHIDARCLVYPHPLPAGPLPISNTNSLRGSGATRELNDDFYAVREYQSGDSLRSIHWRSLAKGLEPMTRQFSGEATADELWLNGDHFNSGIEDTLSRLTQWVIDAEISGHRYGLKYRELQIVPAHGSAHLNRCLEALALYGVGQYGNP